MKEKIIELRKKGYSVNKISEELNCAKSTVSYHINKVNLGGSKNNFLFGITDEIISQIKDLRLSGKTYDEILTIVAISKDKLVKICRKIDLNFNIKNLKASKVNHDEIKKYYREVKSQRKVSEFFNLSRDTIKKIIGDEKIKRVRKNSRSKDVIEWRKRKKLELVNYKGGKCEKCGYNKSITALHFHHKNPSEKDFNISAKSYSLERLKKEVDKCLLLCSNCHCEMHDELKQK